MTEEKKTELKVDAQRYSDYKAYGEETAGTGIYVRAKHGETWANVDIITLDKHSLLAWLKSRGESNKWAEDVVGILLGHGHLHDT